MPIQTITPASTLTIPVGKNLTISSNNAVQVLLLRSTSVNFTSCGRFERNRRCQPTQTSAYTLRIRTAAGCEATASVTITVAPIDITARPTQKVVSPNGDSIKDTWVVGHLERHERHYLRIVGADSV